MLGKEVRKLLQEKLPGRHYKIQWDGRDDPGAWLPSGIYLVRRYWRVKDWFLIFEI
jgi:hypothetical protein